jgi:hypothetical protein
MFANNFQALVKCLWKGNKTRSTIGPVEFIDRVIKHDEKSEPFMPRAGNGVETSRAGARSRTPAGSSRARQKNRLQAPESSGLTGENAWHKRISLVR